MVLFVLDYKTELDLYSTNSQKQQSNCRHACVPPFEHIILIPIEPVYALTSWCCVPGEAASTKFIVYFTSPDQESNP